MDIFKISVAYAFICAVLWLGAMLVAWLFKDDDK